MYYESYHSTSLWIRLLVYSFIIFFKSYSIEQTGLLEGG